jgi:hypothetical protein
MKRLGMTLFLFIGLLVPFAVARAQAPLQIEQLQIDIWPEYDKPSVLIIYKITLPTQASMPAQVTLRIPKDVVQPSSVAMQDVDNLLYNLNYTLATEGDWVKVTFTAPTPNLQMEYYSPLTKTRNMRSFDFNWPGDYQVNNLIFRVQQPVNASQLTILPTQGTSLTDQDGITFFTNPVGPVAERTTVTIKINYTKPDDKLTSALIAPRPSTPIPTGQTTTGNLLQGLNTALVAVVAGVVLVGGGAFWFFTQRQARQTSSAHRRHAAPTDSRRETIQKRPAESEAIYCHQCGKRAGPGDVFCRSCGTRLH